MIDISEWVTFTVRKYCMCCEFNLLILRLRIQFKLHTFCSCIDVMLVTILHSHSQFEMRGKSDSLQNQTIETLFVIEMAWKKCPNQSELIEIMIAHAVLNSQYFTNNIIIFDL